MRSFSHHSVLGADYHRGLLEGRALWKQRRSQWEQTQESDGDAITRIVNMMQSMAPEVATSRQQNLLWQLLVFAQLRDDDTAVKIAAMPEVARAVPALKQRAYREGVEDSMRHGLVRLVMSRLPGVPPTFKPDVADSRVWDHEVMLTALRGCRTFQEFARRFETLSAQMYEQGRAAGLDIKIRT